MVRGIAWILLLCGMAAFGQTRIGIVSTVSQLDTLYPGQAAAYQLVMGNLSVADWGEAKLFRWDSTSTAATNPIVRGTRTAVGRWIHDWDGDVRAFGVVLDSEAAATDNTTRLASAVSVAATLGLPLRFPAGSIYINGTIDCANITAVYGAGPIGSALETSILQVAPNTSIFINAGTGIEIRDLHLRGAYYANGKVSTSGFAVQGSGGAQTFRRLYIEGMFGGLNVSTFDSMFSEIDVIAKRPFVVGGGGTQNTFIRCSARGNLFVTPTNSNTSIECSSYTAGETTFTVTDTTSIQVGDYIRVRSSTEYPNTITYRFRHRKVTAVTPSTVTINYPWDLSFSNGRFEFALGRGYSAFETTTENVVTGCNAEWGSWDHIISNNSGPTASATVNGLHVEGWVADAGVGNANYVFNGINTSVSGTYVDMANCVFFSTDGPALFEPGTRGYLDTLHVRDFEQYQSTPEFWIFRTLTQTYGDPAVVRQLNNSGAVVNQYTFDGNQWRNMVNDVRLGDGGDQVKVEGFGVGQATFYGLGATPTSGNFVRGDRILTTAGEVIRVLDTGSFRTAAGNNEMRAGSAILIVDQDARAVLGRRTPVAFAVTNGLTVSTNHLVVEALLRNSPDTSTLSAGVLSGSRMVPLTSASGVQQGDPFIITEGSTFSDGMVARVQDNYVWSTFPVTNTFTTSATFRTGLRMFSVSTNDVHWQAVKFSPPTFITELDYQNKHRVGGPSVTDALTVVGGWNGAAGVVFERTGVGTNEMTFSGEQIRFRDKSDTRYLSSWLKSGGTIFSGLGNSSGNATPLNGVLQAEAGSGTNVSGGSLTIRPGQGTGSAASSTLALAAPIVGSSGASAQSYGTGLRIQFPSTPDATVSNSPIQSLRYDGTNWVTMSLTWTNESGLWRQYWR